jgi:Photosynthetic reaction centre cytochrome C subunit
MYFSVRLNRSFRDIGTVLGMGLLSLTLVHAQAPSTATSAPHMHPPNPKPVNLHVLPKDMNPDALHELMHGYSAQLGVQCSYCHAPSATGKGLDFASDSKTEKATARKMISMALDINEKYLPKALPVDSPEQVACGTCHRGHAKPEAFVPPPSHEHEGH